MPPYSNTTAALPVNNPDYFVNPAILTGARDYIFAWCATARSLEASAAGPLAPVAQNSARTAKTCYMRGLKEKIQIQTNNGTPWQWRRVCFTTKSQNIINAEQPNYRISSLTTSGWTRVLNNVSGSPLASTILDPLFRGRLGGDWQGDQFTAQLDSSRVDIKFDKTRIFQSGNSAGVMRNVQLWHPMNKNLVYNDDEFGGTMEDYYFSTTAKPGMGDYYVIDFIRAGTGATTADLMTFNPSATLYWHEK